VNWKFLPEAVFVGTPLAATLLALTLGAWAFFFLVKWPAAAVAQGGAKRTDLAPSYIVYTLFVSNFVGVAFARTLHYQFYSWQVECVLSRRVTF
jgi:alpha-1,3-mannosyltransferase